MADREVQEAPPPSAPLAPPIATTAAANTPTPSQAASALALADNVVKVNVVSSVSANDASSAQLAPTVHTVASSAPVPFAPDSLSDLIQVPATPVNSAESAEDPVMSVRVTNTAAAPLKTNSESGVNKDKTNDAPEDDQKEDDDEEPDVDAIIEVSPNDRFRKRNQRCPRHTPGVDAAFYAFDQRVGKEVIWNEVHQVRPEQEPELFRIMKKFKKANHPYIIRILDFWRVPNNDGTIKFVTITERLEEGTLKQFMSNSTGTRSLKMWKKYTGNLLSVLRFFAEVGLTHGNLTNDTIHHQKNGTLKVGTFALDDVLNPNATRDMTKFVKTRHYFAPEYYDPSKKITGATDVYAAGVLSLEIAVLDTQIEDLQLEPEARINDMLSRLTNSEQRDFIRCCLAKEPNRRLDLESLCHHPALIEIPRLALLAGSRLVAIHTFDHIQKLLESTLENILEDDMVIATMIKNGTERSKLWKEVAPGNVLSLKYLEEIKSGFHPLFGYRSSKFSAVAPPAESGRPATPPDGPQETQQQTDGRAQMDTVSGPAGEVTDVCGTGVASVAAHAIAEMSTSSTPKETSQPATPMASAITSAQTTLTGGAGGLGAAAAAGCTAEEGAELVDAASEHQLLKDERTTDVDKDKLDDEDDDDEDNEDNLDHVPKQRDTFQRPKDTNNTPPCRVVSCYIYYIGLGRWNVHLGVYFEESRCMRQCTMQALEQDYWRHKKLAQIYQEIGAINSDDFPEVAQRLYFALRGHPTVNGLYHNLEELARQQGWQLPPDLQLPADNNTPFTELLGRFTERDIPVDPGTANFQIHNLMDKLQRLQQERVAERALEEPDLFPSARDQAAQCLDDSTVGSESAALHQGDELSSHVNEPPQSPPAGVWPDELAGSDDLDFDDEYADDEEEEEDVDGQTSTSLGMSSVDPSVESSAQMSRSVSGQPPLDLDTHDNPCRAEWGASHPPDPITWGCGGKCQRYRQCRYCDKSDYLMRSELKPYLTHPCYHCRAALSKDAGLSKTELWYAHIEYGIPWPFFLTCLLGPPLEDAQMEPQLTMEEMVEYECAHRARRPCRCLKDKHGKVRLLPPCQEFPEDYWTDDENDPSLEPSCPTASCPFNPVNRKPAMASVSSAMPSDVVHVGQSGTARNRRRKRQRPHYGEEVPQPAAETEQVAETQILPHC